MSNRRRGFREDSAAFQPKSSESLREVPSSAAKTHLPELLDEVERGATIVITRRGRAIARLVPDEEGRRAEVSRALDEIKKIGQEIRREHGPMSIEEILGLRHEGHKY